MPLKLRKVAAEEWNSYREDNDSQHLDKIIEYDVCSFRRCRTLSHRSKIKVCPLQTMKRHSQTNMVSRSLETREIGVGSRRARDKWVAAPPPELQPLFTVLFIIALAVDNKVWSHASLSTSSEIQWSKAV